MSFSIQSDTKENRYQDQDLCGHHVETHFVNLPHQCENALLFEDGVKN